MSGPNLTTIASDDRPTIAELETRWELKRGCQHTRDRKRLKPRRRMKPADRRRYERLLLALKSALIELRPWCACCGRTVQAVNDERIDFAKLLNKQLHCRRCFVMRRERPYAEPATAALKPEADEYPANLDATEVTVTIPAELWRKFSARCKAAGTNTTRMLAALILSSLPKGTPNPHEWGIKYRRALQLWERSMRRHKRRR